MNDIDKMPSKCQSCPYWEVCEYPYICDDIKPKQHENGNINAESAENLRNRSANGDLISRQAAIDALDTIHYTDREDWWAVLSTVENLPPVQPDEKLEKCRFEYINACRTVTFPTPDTTKKDISDAYAVIKVLQPIFGDVTL